MTPQRVEESGAYLITQGHFMKASCQGAADLEIPFFQVCFAQMLFPAYFRGDML